MTYAYAELKTLLQNEVAMVTFDKSDGTTRVMKCTLLPEFLPVVSLDENKKVRQENLEVMPVWDIENSGWRSFRIDSIKNIEVV
jgi:hypothetical protein